MSFLHPAAFLLGLLAIPLIFLYFLKLRRPQQKVGSLTLWRQVNDDRRVNSPFQRFRRNLLLWLQLGMLAAAVLAAAQPLWRKADSEMPSFLPILIDHSASMAASSDLGSPTPFAQAIAHARAVIENKRPDQQICLLSASDRARQLTPFTADRSHLLAALDSLKIEQTGSHIEPGLRMVAALRRTHPFDRLLFLSDGNLPAEMSLELPYLVDFHRLGDSPPNMGIVAASARRRGNSWELFVEVSASLGQGAARGARLRLAPDPSRAQQGNLDWVAEEYFSILPGASRRLIFEPPAGQDLSLQIELLPDGHDALEADNTAYIHLARPSLPSVYVPESLASVRHAIAALQQVSLHPDPDSPLPQTFDLVISDRPEDMARDAVVYALFNHVPDELASLVTSDESGDSPIDWHRDHPLLEHVSLEEVLLIAHHSAPKLDRQLLSSLGFEAVAWGRSSPLILIRDATDRLTVHFLFHPDGSTLPFRVAFPILISNLLRQALDRTGQATVEALANGTLHPVAAGSAEAKLFNSEGQLIGSASTMAIDLPRQTGSYLLSSPTSTLPVGTSLLSRRETSLATIEELMFSELAATALSQPTGLSQFPLWRHLLWLGLLFLIVEWWLAQRPISPRQTRLPAWMGT